MIVTEATTVGAKRLPEHVKGRDVPDSVDHVTWTADSLRGTVDLLMSVMVWICSVFVGAMAATPAREQKSVPVPVAGQLDVSAVRLIIDIIPAIRAFLCLSEQ